MQSSVRSETPRAATLRSLSPTSVHVNREVTVVSSPSPGAAIKRTRYSHMPSSEQGHGRPQTSPSLENVRTTPSNQWNSRKTSIRSSMRHSRGSFHGAAQDEVALESNRESMKALADFLMTRDPPPTNWVSIPSDDESTLGSIKKSAFKLFGSRKSKKHKPTRFLQLPDSAVAAETRSGARHIAISIPIEHDHIEEPEAHPQIPNQNQRPLPQRHPSKDKHTVTVLKPVAELRESGSSYLSSPKTKSSNSELNHVQQESMTKISAQVVASKPLKDYYTGLDAQSKSPGRELSSGLDSARSNKSPLETSHVFHQDSQRSDPRHSGGTAYSTFSFGHSRGPSSISTAPSATLISSLKHDLPPRKSSMSKVSRAVQTEPTRTSNPVMEIPLSPSQSRTSDPATSITHSSPSPPTVVKTATIEIVRRYSPSGEGGPQIVRSITPKTINGLSPSPSKRLPSDQVQLSSDDFLRPKTAPPFQRGPVVTLTPPQQVAVAKPAEEKKKNHGTEDSLRVTRQNREERVKARKQRDIEGLRSISGSRAVPAETIVLNNTSRPPPTLPMYTTKSIAPPRNPRRNVDHNKNKGANTLSPVMVVANLAPYTGTVLLSDLPSPARKFSRQIATKSSNSNSNSNTIRSTQHTPPHSLSSPTSDSEENYRRNRHSNDAMVSPTKSLLESRRKERRIKRNMREREKELDDRIGKIERDNEILMHTLSGIAKGFGDLAVRVSKNGGEIASISGLGMEERRRERLLDVVGRGMQGVEEGGKDRTHDLRGVESMMRELQVLAPRVSLESEKGWVGDEFSDDDGASVLL